MGAVHQAPRGLIRFSSASLVVLWQEFGFYKSVEFAEQDIGKHGTQDGALRDAAQRFVECPVFQVPSIEQFLDEAEKSSVLNRFSEC